MARKARGGKADKNPSAELMLNPTNTSMQLLSRPAKNGDLDIGVLNTIFGQEGLEQHRNDPLKKLEILNKMLTIAKKLYDMKIRNVKAEA